MMGSNRAIVIGGSLGAVLALSGCGALENARGAESIFELFQGPSPEDAITDAFNEYDADARYRGITQLSSTSIGGGDSMVALYRQRLQDSDTGVRAAAIRALGIHGSTEDAGDIAEMLLDSEDKMIRVEAAWSLQRLHNPEVVPALLASIRTDQEAEPAVRAPAAFALGQYHERRVLQALVTALDDRHLTVNENARDALKTLTGQDFGVDTNAWVSWLGKTNDPFAAGHVYTYKGYSRPKHPIEYLPFVPQPPRERPGAPVGMSRDVDT